MGTLSPLAAGAIVDGIGVNIHDGWGVADRTDNSNAYGRLDIVRLLAWLGVRHVRCGDIELGGQSRTAQLSIDTQLSAAGIRALRVVAGSAALAALQSGGYAEPEAVEPYNEWDASGPSATWAADLASFQPTLYAAIKAQWPACTVLGPSMANISGYTAYASTQSPLTTKADGSSVHIYARPAATHEYLPLAQQSNIPTYQGIVPGKPVWVTEHGHAAGASLDGAVECDEMTAARLGLRALAYLLAPTTATTVNCTPYPTGTGGFGASRAYVYELLDQHANPYYTNTREDRFGLFDYRGRPKQHAHTLRNFMTALADPTGTPTLTPLNVTLSGQAAINVSHLLLQKTDGSYWLLFWNPGNAAPYPSGGSGGPLPAGNAVDDSGGGTVTFTFGTAFNQIHAYRPMRRRGGQQIATASSTATVTLRPEVQMLRLANTAPVGEIGNHRGLAGYSQTRAL